MHTCVALREPATPRASRDNNEQTVDRSDHTPEKRGMVAAAKRGAGAKAVTVKLTPEAQAALLSVETQYKNWDVVWARMAGFPWWPGIVFLNWEVPLESGVPLPKEFVAINEPEERVVAAIVNGKEEQKVVTDYYCLVMFLDKGDWFVANMNLHIQPFASNYAANCKPTHKKGKSSAFKVALQRATKLLHLVRDAIVQGERMMV